MTRLLLTYPEDDEPNGGGNDFLVVRHNERQPNRRAAGQDECEPCDDRGLEPRSEADHDHRGDEHRDVGAFANELSNDVRP